MLNLLLVATAILAQGSSQAKPQTPIDKDETPATTQPPLVAPDHDPKHLADLEHDDSLGRKYASEVAKEYKVSKNKEYVARVQRIGDEMAAIARVTPVHVQWGDKRLNPFNYSFTVVKGDDVNAFSLPGGRIYVLEGLVKYVETDDELAGVLAHEISHAESRHVATLQHEQTKLERVTLPLVLLSVLAGGAAGGVQALEMGQLVGMAKGSGWSLKAELSADAGGFQYLTKSKYNPTGLLTVMERLAIDERNSPKISLGIFQSHPPSRERADAVQAMMAEAHIPLERSKVTTTFRAMEKPVDKGVVEIWFANRKIYAFAGPEAKKRADEALPKLNKLFDRAPDLFEVAKDGDDIVYKHESLIEITDTDADAAKTKVDDLTSKTLKAIQGSLYVIAFRIWDDR